MAEQRPWLKNYSGGVPANIDPEAFCSVVEMMEATFEKYRKQVAFSCMGKSLTFDQIDKMSKQFGAYLLSRGLEPGDRIALMMPNLLQYPIALFGALRAGLVIVNTNPLYTPREMKHQFTDFRSQSRCDSRKLRFQSRTNPWRNGYQNRHPHQHWRNAWGRSKEP